MTKAEAHAIFREIIWQSELQNLTLSEYLDTYPEQDKIWKDTTKACISAGINLYEVQCK